MQYPTGGGAVAWTADGKGFWYTRYPDETASESERHFNMKAYLHWIGSDPANDKLVLSDADGLPRTAEISSTTARAACARWPPSSLATAASGSIMC